MTFKPHQVDGCNLVRTFAAVHTARMSKVQLIEQQRGNFTPLQLNAVNQFTVQVVHTGVLHDSSRGGTEEDGHVELYRTGQVELKRTGHIELYRTGQVELKRTGRVELFYLSLSTTI
eukprot:Em0012g273a